MGKDKRINDMHAFDVVFACNAQIIKNSSLHVISIGSRKPLRYNIYHVIHAVVHGCVLFNSIIGFLFTFLAWRQSNFCGAHTSTVKSSRRVKNV